jgi:hypothetical protein
VGKGFYQQDPASGRAYCQACLLECPTCHKLTPGTVVCAACGKTGCSACTESCKVCRKPFCAEHIRRYAECGHTVCTAHSATCAHCREEVCPVCWESCAICERHHCATHSQVCRRCEQLYCSGCVHESGLCATCAGLEQHGAAVDLAAEPCMADERVAGLAPHYRWRRLSNARYIILVGESSFLSRAVIVVAKAGGGRRVVAVRRLSALDRLRDQFGFT